MITSSHVVSHKKIFHLITVNGSGEVITQAQGSYVNYTTAIATCQKSTGWLCSKPRGKVVAKTIPLWSVLKGIPGNINKITKFTGKKFKKVEFAQLEPSKAHQNYKCLCQDTKQWHRYKKTQKAPSWFIPLAALPPAHGTLPPPRCPSRRSAPRSWRPELGRPPSAASPEHSVAHCSRH